MKGIIHIMKDRRPLRAGLVTLLLVPAAAVLTACGGEDGQEGEGASSPAGQDVPAAAQPMSEEAQSFVDQGNEAQREGRYEEALGLYREGMEADPEHPVPQFGALMASMALGDTALADSLRVRLARTSPDLLDMLNPDGSMGAGMGDPHTGAGAPGGMQNPMPTMPPRAGSGELPPGHPPIPDTTGDTVAPDTIG